MTQTITLIPGDGIGPEITESVIRVLQAAGVDYEWDLRMAGEVALAKTGNLLPTETLESFQRNKVCLKGPLTTPVGEGFRSVNVELRRRFDLYANIRPAKSMAGIQTRYKGVDIVLFRENVEGEYCGIDAIASDGQSASMRYNVTRAGCKRIMQAAFEYALANNRKKVTLVHKANIMKHTQGLMLESFREEMGYFPEIEPETLIVDNCCMQLVKDPTRFDVMVTSNLFGDILSDLNAGLVGGLGVVGSANIGSTHSMFEAVHGSAPDIAGQGLANPTSLLLASTLMLRHLGDPKRAEMIEYALQTTLHEDPAVLTKDIGGTGTTETFTRRLIELTRELRGAIYTAR